jgi:hypothetical protein
MFSINRKLCGHHDTIIFYDDYTWKGDLLTYSFYGKNTDDLSTTYFLQNKRTGRKIIYRKKFKTFQVSYKSGSCWIDIGNGVHIENNTTGYHNTIYYLDDSLTNTDCSLMRFSIYTSHGPLHGTSLANRIGRCSFYRNELRAITRLY